jgi:hypothetical protein
MSHGFSAMISSRVNALFTRFLSTFPETVHSFSAG